MADDKTEKPTAKKLKDARKDGQVVRSRDLAVAAATVAATIVIGRMGARIVTGLAEHLSRDLSHLDTAGVTPVVAGDLARMTADTSLTLASLVGPVAMACMVVSIGVNAMQGGLSFSPKALAWNLSRLSPAHGLQRLSFKQSGLDTAKSLVSVAVIAWLAYQALTAMMQDIPTLVWMSPFRAASWGWDRTVALLWRVAWALMLLAIADYGLQYYRLMSSLKMTKQEIKDEAKSSEGNAEMKGRVRRIQRDMARRRMISDVAKATVVITNPTHFAVALEYRRGEMSAPIVLAKGQDHVAAKIREQARAHGIPLVENKPLAQALYKTAEVGEAIPGTLFSAVAEVLAQLVRLRQLVL